MTNFFVYAITHIVSGDVVYIGATSSFLKRQSAHVSKYPPEKYSMDIVVECDDKEEMFQMEKMLIKAYKPPGNMIYIKHCIEGLYRRTCWEQQN